jgi:hypothetical protein
MVHSIHLIIGSNTANIESSKIVVNYGEFAERKDEGDLFDDDEQKERIEMGKYEFNEKEYKKKLKKNDQIVYEMYNKYKYILEELDLYESQLLERIINVGGE